MKSQYAIKKKTPTARELQVVDLAARGLTFKEVGCHLGISEKTVGVHADNIRDKLAAHNMAQAFRVLVERGYIQLRSSPVPIDRMNSLIEESILDVRTDLFLNEVGSQLNRLINESIRETGRRLVEEWSREAA